MLGTYLCLICDHSVSDMVFLYPIPSQWKKRTDMSKICCGFGSDTGNHGSCFFFIWIAGLRIRNLLILSKTLNPNLIAESISLISLHTIASPLNPNVGFFYYLVFTSFHPFFSFIISFNLCRAFIGLEVLWEVFRPSSIRIVNSLLH